MSDWYYATADGQRHGPLQAAEMHALATDGTIAAQTLVWRDGLPGWRPLHELASELGLPALPPPLVAPVAPRPPPSGLSGCAIAALVAVAGVFMLAVLGILAAIALPAYNDYTQRSRAAAAIAEARVHQGAVADFMAAHGRCPRNGDPGFERATHYASAHLVSIEFGEFEASALCGLVATINAPGNEALDGNAIWLEYNPAVDTWLCSSAVEDRYLPHACRG
ncbi:GYF domain-containing protein [Pseudoxanthomonas suwonensis]|uniref:PilA-related fimbrial protein n=1 Tax=Pseudoxanthomonas suwonensis TaxID=314722 RepID=A0A0E3Z1A8_9GAMM|nr:GYF domain-containing protein [Pseudoxanthomonas suwonensis]AKC86502.1 PilA-related fimbrial protein [Pseudoxanthomonas suwonensis]